MNVEVFCFDARSREGAWIEMIEAKANATNARIAPVRERGLKY